MQCPMRCCCVRVFPSGRLDTYVTTYKLPSNIVAARSGQGDRRYHAAWRCFSISTPSTFYTAEDPGGAARSPASPRRNADGILGWPKYYPPCRRKRCVGEGVAVASARGVADSRGRGTRLSAALSARMGMCTGPSAIHRGGRSTAELCVISGLVTLFLPPRMCCVQETSRIHFPCDGGY